VIDTIDIYHVGKVLVNRGDGTRAQCGCKRNRAGSQFHRRNDKAAYMTEPRLACVRNVAGEGVASIARDYNVSDSTRLQCNKKIGESVTSAVREETDRFADTK
jgi:hypothetical protein